VTSIRSGPILTQFELFFVKICHHGGSLMIDFFEAFYVILGAISVMKWPNLRNVAKSRYSDISDPELYLVKS
jgi:hypothetical protein